MTVAVFVISVSNLNFNQLKLASHTYLPMKNSARLKPQPFNDRVETRSTNKMKIEKIIGQSEDEVEEQKSSDDEHPIFDCDDSSDEDYGSEQAAADGGLNECDDEVYSSLEKLTKGFTLTFKDIKKHDELSKEPLADLSSKYLQNIIRKARQKLNRENHKPQ